MTDFTALLQPDRGEPARLIHLVDKESFPKWVKSQPADRQAMLEAVRFDGKSAFQFAILPGKAEFEVVTAVDNAKTRPSWC